MLRGPTPGTPLRTASGVVPLLFSHHVDFVEASARRSSPVRDSLICDAWRGLLVNPEGYPSRHSCLSEPSGIQAACDLMKECQVCRPPASRL